MGVLLMLHSLNRWLIIIVALITLIRLITIWVRQTDTGSLDKRLVSVFGALLGIQMLIGLIFLVWSGLSGAGFPAYRLGHAVIMFVAVTVGNLPERWKASPTPQFARNTVFAIVGALVLIGVGVAILPGGWSR